MEEKKNLCAPIPLSLHQRLRAEQEQRGQTLAHWFEHIIEDGVEELFACAVANTSVDVVLLEFLKVLELRPVVGEVVIAAECLKICEYGISLKVARLIHRHAWSRSGG